jgi:hypothetical protein
MSRRAETNGGKDRAMTDLSDAGPARLPTWERPPFFVVGYVRSGTTLFRRMLDMHPELSVLEELDDFQRIPRRIGKGIEDEAGLKAFVDALPIFYKRTIYDPDRFLEIAMPRLPLKVQDVISLLKSSARIMADKPGARWGHKEPHEWPFVYQLREWYPEGQFLHIVRRPHDVVASVAHYNKDVGLHAVSTTPVISAWHWRTSFRSVLAQGETLGPKRDFFLRYEDLVEDPTEMLGKVAAFLGVSQDGVAQMMEFHKQPLDRPQRRTHGPRPAAGKQGRQEPRRARPVGSHAPGHRLDLPARDDGPRLRASGGRKDRAAAQAQARGHVPCL